MNEMTRKQTMNELTRRLHQRKAEHARAQRQTMRMFAVLALTHLLALWLGLAL